MRTADVTRNRGFACLNAAVVVAGGQAVALAGPPGVAKSMLAAALVTRGHRVLTDDMASVSQSGARFMVHPGPSRLRPRRETASPAPLAALWFLEPRPGQTVVRVDPLRPSDAVMRLVGDAWARRLQDRAMRAQDIDQVSQVVGTATARLLTFDPDMAWLQDACRAIEQLAFVAQRHRQAS